MSAMPVHSSMNTTSWIVQLRALINSWLYMNFILSMNLSVVLYSGVLQGVTAINKMYAVVIF